MYKWMEQNTRGVGLGWGMEWAEHIARLTADEKLLQC
jgi:hypothetical protein